MLAKYNISDKVIVSGEASGYGDLKGTIVEVSKCKILSQPYYTVRVLSSIGTFFPTTMHVAEKFIQKID